MITEKDLREAIKECQGENNPNAHTCLKLAAYYTILNYMTAGFPSGYSAAGDIKIDSGSEFAAAVNGGDPQHVLTVMDELMQTLNMVNPKLYDGVMRKLNE